MSARTVATRQTVLSINIDGCAADTAVRANEWCSETQTDGDTDSCVVHLQADGGQWQSVQPVAGARRTSRKKTSTANWVNGCIE